MGNLIWLLRASRWARRPPSTRMVILVLGIIAVALLLVGLEKLGMWPDWATLQQGRGRLPR
ncbi:hypothetical protein [Paracoccus pacificus]|uniref:Uncharacterized protein n=1 Tax=Paracoccus pacificus TaxID=1463598 RepID=A0ABW4R5P2_9RHOB